MATWPEPVEVISLDAIADTSTSLSNLEAPTTVVFLDVFNDFLQPLGTYPIPIELIPLVPLPEADGQYPIWETVVKTLQFETPPTKEAIMSSDSIIVIPLRCEEGPDAYQYWG